MKTIKRSLAALLIVVLIFSLVGCSGGSIVGTWEATVEGETMEWEFKKDGKLAIEGQDGATYEVDGDEISIEMFGEELEGTFKIKGNELTITIDDEPVTFKRK